MRERLIEILGKSGLGDVYYCEFIADHLLAEGVIVPPVKVGQTCYRVWQKEIIELKIVSVSYEPTPAPSYLVGFDRIGVLYLMQDGSKNEERSWDDVFLTREEAEKVIAEREGKG